jgi:hypothetical protein
MVGSPFAALTQDIAPILAQVVKRSGPPPGTDVGTYGTAANIETLNIPCSAAQAVANAYALFSCTLGFSSYDAFSFADFFNRFLKRTGLSTPTTTLVLPNGYLFSQWNYVCLTE